MKIKNKNTGEVILEINSLRDAYLRYANLRGADLRGADLIGADLRNSNLRDANLENAYLRNSNLRDADLRDADLEGAYLRDADLWGADLRGAILGGVNLEGAKNYYSFTAYGTSGRIVHCVKHKKTWMIKAGCFWGSIKELEEKVLKTHNSSVYLANIEILKQI